MRIDASNLLLAAQVQPRPAAAVKPPQSVALEPAPLETKATASGSKPAAIPGPQRLGQKLDIRI
jgi:hypothetical protein